MTSLEATLLKGWKEELSGYLVNWKLFLFSCWYVAVIYIMDTNFSAYKEKNVLENFSIQIHGKKYLRFFSLVSKHNHAFVNFEIPRIHSSTDFCNDLSEVLYLWYYPMTVLFWSWHLRIESRIFFKIHSLKLTLRFTKRKHILSLQ